MQTKRAILISFLLCGLILFWSFQAIGGEWTEAQKEVWKTVQANWETFKEGDLEATMAMQHDDAVVWWAGKPIPFLNKELMKRSYREWFVYEKPVSYKLQPLTIQIVHNVAIVCYLCDWKGPSKIEELRVLETWIKQDNRWIQIGSFSASCDIVPSCLFD